MPSPHALALAAQLPGVWSGQAALGHYTVLCSHFGQGQAFAAVLQAWRGCPQRPERLVFVSQATQWPDAPTPAGTDWPPPTRNLHLLDFEGGRVRLLLALGLDSPWRQLRQVQADALWLDGQDFSRDNPRSADGHPTAGDSHSDHRQTTAAMKAVARLAAWQCRLALWQATPEQASALRAAGFVFDGGAAPLLTARFQPTFGHRLQQPPPSPARPAGHAVVVGAGIAGACAAAALARRGWQCTVLDARAQPAGGGSGNPAAIFHGTVHAADGPHARFTRAAALHAQRFHARLMAQGVPGQVDGLLRADAQPVSPPPPERWASRWSAATLQAHDSGLRADSAWFFPGGGWIDASAAVRTILQTPGVRFQGQACAAGLRRVGSTGQDWQVLDADGQALAEPGPVVLAGAGAGDLPCPPMAWLANDAQAWPLPFSRARGQVSWFQHDGPALPRPVAGGGYALSLPGGGPLLCGATTQADDDDPRPREGDHAFNLERLLTQTGIAPAAGTSVHGRVGWRERVADRLPVVGAALDSRAVQEMSGRSTSIGAGRLSRLPRVPGLFVLGAMAGRGFTWGPLAGEVLASWVDGSPSPLEADLLDALDPARFWLRQARRERGPVRD